MLRVARLWHSCWMNVPYNDEMILCFLKTAPLSSYHRIFAFLTVYVSWGADKRSFINEISTVASGGKPNFMAARPNGSKISTDGEKRRAQTPGIFFQACLRMIHVIRNCFSTCKSIS